MRKKSLSLKLKKNVNFLTIFCLGNISNRLGAIASRDVSLKGNVYYFSVDYNAVDKSEKYLMVKNNMK